MANKRPITLVGGVTEETHSVEWKIKNFRSIQQDEKLLFQQKHSFEIGKFPSSKWELGFVKQSGSSPKFFHGCVTLLEASSVSARMSFGYIKSCRVLNKVTKTFTKDDSKLVFSSLSLEYNKIYGPDEKYSKSMSFDSAGTLTFYLDISILHDETLERKKPRLSKLAMDAFAEKSSALLRADLAALLEDKINYDVKIFCRGGETVNAHELILKARFPAFFTLQDPQKEKTDSEPWTIRKTEFSKKTMEILLHYWYTGELKAEWKEEDVKEEFIQAAGKYQIHEVLAMLADTAGPWSE